MHSLMRKGTAWALGYALFGHARLQQFDSFFFSFHAGVTGNLVERAASLAGRGSFCVRFLLLFWSSIVMCVCVCECVFVVLFSYSFRSIDWRARLAAGDYSYAAWHSSSCSLLLLVVCLFVCCTCCAH